MRNIIMSFQNLPSFEYSCHTGSALQHRLETTRTSYMISEFIEQQCLCSSRDNFPRSSTYLKANPWFLKNSEVTLLLTAYDEEQCAEVKSKIRFFRNSKKWPKYYILEQIKLMRDFCFLSFVRQRAPQPPCGRMLWASRCMSLTARLKVIF